MRIAIRIIQLLVGVLFILSGLVKANDPLGLSYKMQEFFEIWNFELQSSSFFAKNALISLFKQLHGGSLGLSVAMITLEIVAGVALLIGWRKKAVLWILLALIIFFTFLTGYAYLSTHPDGSPKFTNCGCFGDCLPIPPLASFSKDIALVILIALLLLGQKFIQPLFSIRGGTAAVLTTLLLSLLFQWYALSYGPPVDCLPFKKGNSIPEKMKAPPGSRPDSVAMRFIYEKNGKEYEFTMESFPPDLSTYTYKDRIDKVIRKGNAEPPIKGFTLIGADQTDSTQIVLQQPRAVIVFILSSTDIKKWAGALKEVATAAAKSQVPVYLATAQKTELEAALNIQGLPLPVFACDYTVIRTAARTNPGFYLLRNGTIEMKTGHLRAGELVTQLTKR